MATFAEIIYGGKEKVEVINELNEKEIDILRNIFGAEKTNEQIYNNFFDSIDIYRQVKNRLQ